MAASTGLPSSSNGALPGPSAGLSPKVSSAAHLHSSPATAAPLSTTVAATATPLPPIGPPTPQPPPDKAPTKKKQLGNWLFKKFGGSGSNRHHPQHSTDSSSHEQHSYDTEVAGHSSTGLHHAAVNGMAVATAAGGGSGSGSGSGGGVNAITGGRSRRPSFPRTRKMTGSDTAGLPPHANGHGNGSAQQQGESSYRRMLGGGSAGNNGSLRRPSSADAKHGGGVAGEGSSSGGGGGMSGMVSSFWRASHLDGVPSPSLPRSSKPRSSAGPTSTAAAYATISSRSRRDTATARDHRRVSSSSPGLMTDGLADTLVLPTTPLEGGVSPPPQLPDPLVGPSLTREALEPLAARMGASSPTHSQAGFSIGTTSLGTDTSAPASSINSLVRIRNGQDLRNGGFGNVGSSSGSGSGLVGIGLGLNNGGGGSGVSRARRHSGLTTHTTEMLDIPDGMSSTNGHVSESDSDDSQASDRAWRRRYSGDNATMDTGKSASTKPTTVMSLETRDASGAGPTMMAHIAQYRHGDPTSPSFGPQYPTASASNSLPRSAQTGTASIQFADPMTPGAHHHAQLHHNGVGGGGIQLIRSASGHGAPMMTGVAGPSGSGSGSGNGGTASGSASMTGIAAAVSQLLPGQGQPIEDAGPFVNVPTFSRPHPSNNPTPQGIPADNASLLTLASSTAAQSIMGGLPGGGGGLGGTGPTPSVRTHGRAPSFFATRSLGGGGGAGGGAGGGGAATSLMGDRRNSSDTYASLKALPPLSRRGSDASARTGLESVAPSVSGVGIGFAAGVDGGGAGRGGTGATSTLGGPGAPYDRVGSLHRSPSMRTVNTQLSVPLSLAAAHQGTMAPAPGPLLSAPSSALAASTSLSGVTAQGLMTASGSGSGSSGAATGAPAAPSGGTLGTPDGVSLLEPDALGGSPLGSGIILGGRDTIIP
ncbi:hypothetical protein V8E36_009708 [Tilletia maclaganii]